MVRQIQGQFTVRKTARYAGRPVAETELMRFPEGLAPDLSEEKRCPCGIKGLAVDAKREDIAFKSRGSMSVFCRNKMEAFPYQTDRLTGTRQSRL